MPRNQVILLIAFAVLGLGLAIYEVARRGVDDTNTPPAASSGDGTSSGDAMTSGKGSVGDRIADGIERRMDGMRPRRDAAGRPDLDTGEPRGEVDDRVILEILDGGAVRHAGTTYDIEHEDAAKRAAAEDALRKALLKVHEARGGEKLREADGRTGLELTLRGAGAMQPGTLKRLIDVCGREPLRAYRFQFDLGGD